MDLASIEEKLAAGESLKVKYRYPRQASPGERKPAYGIRSDRLLDVSIEHQRLYAAFRGDVPVWIEVHEVIEVTPDDGVYEEFPDE